MPKPVSARLFKCPLILLAAILVPLAHVVLHDSEAKLRLGTLALTSATLADRAADLATIGASLAPGGDRLGRTAVAVAAFHGSPEQEHTCLS